SITEIILANKFGTKFREKVRECFFDEYDDKFSSPLGSTLADIFLNDLVISPKHINSVTDAVILGLQKPSKAEKCTAVLGMMGFSFKISRPSEDSTTSVSATTEIFEIMLDLIKTNDLHYHFSICW